MPPQPSLQILKRRLVLIAAAVVLTQLPGLTLLLSGARPGPASLVAYLFASVASAGGVFAVALAWWARIQRIVSLVRGYAESGQLPLHDSPEIGGSFETVQASLASLDRVVRRLETEAARDPLTGTSNRRSCASRLSGDLARALRGGIPFSIILFDLDDLKTVNDRFGHASGDAALRHLAGILGEVVRSGDWVARWGGDEFLLGLWGADREAAVGTAERVFDALGRRPLEFDGVSYVLAASAGVSQAGDGDDAARLFGRADEALYASKREGRGRVSLA